MRARQFKNARIVRAKDGDWRVVYEYRVPGQTGKFRKFYVRDGINYIHDPEEKELAAQQLRDDIDYALAFGFNPFLPQEILCKQIATQEALLSAEVERKAQKPWSVPQTTEKFLEYCRKRGLSENTVRTYVSFLNNLKKYVESMTDPHIPCSALTEQHIQDFLDYYFFEEEWTPRTYNNHAKFMSQFFARAAKLEKKHNRNITYEIDLSDLIIKKDRAEKNRYYSPIVAEKVKAELVKDPELYNYSKWIFYSCMRPKEIRCLKIQDIDLSSRQIKVPGPNGKTGDRLVPICDELHQLIRDMGIGKAKLNHYVFGKGQTISPEQVYEDYFRRRYQKIKDHLKLDYNYTLYSWKHTRVVSLITAGFDDNQVMTLTGHRDRAGFEAYKRELVIDNTIMKKKTISF
ncbi:hypothetical protein GCM10009120_04940 [Sphingobacterium siyangense subsp. cladoniae]